MGTLLADPIEVKAVTEAYRKRTDGVQFCAIGSVKSNMGHPLQAAGIAGMIKILLAMQKGQIPPTINCDKPHPRFKFEESPFYPVTGLQDWTGGKRRAAISSFGFGGTNVHMIVESPPEDYVPRRKMRPITEFKRKEFRTWNDPPPTNWQKTPLN